MIEVVLDVCGCFHEAYLDPLRKFEPVGAVERAHAKRHVLERAPLARALRVEQREFPAACVGADEREIVLPVDDVHAEVARHEVGDRVTLGDPERDVVESIGFHVASLAIGITATRRRSGGSALSSESALQLLLGHT